MWDPDWISIRILIKRFPSMRILTRIQVVDLMWIFAIPGWIYLFIYKVKKFHGVSTKFTILPYDHSKLYNNS